MSFTSRATGSWHLRTRALPLGVRTLVMGILNVTPDSFSDGGRFHSSDLSPRKAVERAGAMLEEGADILDIGGESTRPGATAVRAADEQARVLPVLEAIRAAHPHAILSVDTYHADTAQRALGLGVEIVNDVSGLMWDSAMAGIVAETGAGIVLMHARGTPAQWSTLPPLEAAEVLPTVIAGLTRSLHMARAATIDPLHVVLDPGFGFGKRGSENYTLHAELDALCEMGYPLLVGTSRKGFLAAREARPEVRMAASMASDTAAILSGAHIIRAHDVAAARAASDVADSILQARAELAKVEPCLQMLEA